MSATVVIAPDKFKGTLTAPEAAAAIAKGWRAARPADTLIELPMSDGGDGFGTLTARLANGVEQKVKTVDSAHRPCKASWWWIPATKTAIIETAQVNGLAKLPPGKYHPFELDTYGLGEVFRAAAKKGAKHCVVGIGGSSTNDGGFGLARSLGWQFLDRAGTPIEKWTGLEGLARVIAPKKRKLFPKISVAVDVQNMLLGAKGASRIYGPQKGLKKEDFPLAEACLRKLAAEVKQFSKRDVAKEPGTGAAGGLGFGLVAFLGGKLTPGFALFAAEAKLAQRLRGADLVITGEGAIDKSTLMGKGVGELARYCRKQKLPCLGLAGVLGEIAFVKKHFTEVRALTPDIAPADEAKTRSAFWLAKLAEDAARNWK